MDDNARSLITRMAEYNRRLYEEINKLLGRRVPAALGITGSLVGKNEFDEIYHAAPARFIQDAGYLNPFELTGRYKHAQCVRFGGKYFMMVPLPDRELEEKARQNLEMRGYVDPDKPLDNSNRKECPID